MDLRLGITGNNQQFTNRACETCNENVTKCVGHFGYIDLALPVFNAGYVKVIYNILQCVCKKCGMFLIFSEMSKDCFDKSINELNLQYYTENQKDRLVLSFIRDFNAKKPSIKILIEKSRNIKLCMFCKSKNGKLSRNQEKIQYNDIEINTIPLKDHKTYNFTIKDDLFTKFPSLSTRVTKVNDEIERTFNLETFTAIKCLNLFNTENIKKYYHLFLRTNPADYIISKLLVIPNSLRPTTILTTSKSNEDDLTVKCAEILYINRSLLLNMEKNVPLKNLMADFEALQLHVNLYINSSPTGMTGSAYGVKMIKGIVQRLKGKSGRFRNHLSGKRVDFSARTVITPDPYLKICQVGVPRRMAEILSIEEEVNNLNINKLKGMILNSPKYPSATFITCSNEDGKVFKKKVQPKLKNILAKTLKIGDLVERNLINNDIVLFNRQPSLHRISIMAHRVRIQNTRTLSFNESVCAPYNADFDGDEMNIHVLQTLASQSEAVEIMGVNSNILNRRNDSVSVMPTQDFLTYLYKLTVRKEQNSKDGKQINSLNQFLISPWFNNLSDFVTFTDSELDLMSEGLLKPSVLRPRRIYSGYQIVDVLLFKSAIECDTPFDSYNIEGSDCFYKKCKRRTDISFSDVLKHTRTTSKPFVYKRNKNIDQKERININTDQKERIDKNLEQKERVLAKLKQINFKCNDLEIKGGILIKGTFSKSIVSKFIKYLRYIDGQIANNFTNNVARSSAMNIHKMGFSIGLDDVYCDRTVYKRKVVRDILRNVHELRNKEEDKKEALTVKEVGNLRDLLGISITKYLNREEYKGIPELADILPAHNSALQMFRAGSKGSLLNIIQMVCAVGQQVVGGKRIPEINGRSFVHLPVRTIDARDIDTRNIDRTEEELLEILISRGLIVDSFYTGLSPLAFFCHAVSGREGLVDTAVKTAETGYMQRRLMKGLEDGVMGYDGVVRFSKQIVSFSPIMMHRVMGSSNIKGLSVSLLIERIIYRIIGESGMKYLKNLSVEKYSMIMKCIFQYLCVTARNIQISSDARNSSMNRNSKQNINKCVPELFLILYRVCKYIASTGSNNIDLDTGNSREMKDTIKCSIKEFLFKNEQYIITSIRLYLPLNFRYLDPCGSMAAQSIGEPGTQMTLKTFHFAGAMSMNITLGVPRLKEIINATVSISTSISKVFLRKYHSKMFSFKNFGRIMRRERFMIREFGNEKQLIKAIERINSSTICDSKASGDTKNTGEADPINNQNNSINNSVNSINNQNNICMDEMFQLYVSPTILKGILTQINIVYSPEQVYAELIVNSKTFYELNTAYEFFEKLKLNSKHVEESLTDIIIRKVQKHLSIEQVEFKSDRIVIRPIQDIIYKIQKVKSDLLDIRISGFENVKQVLLHADSFNKNDSEVNSKEIIVEGLSFHSILSCPLTFTALTNNIKELESVLGIEAARQAIVLETIYTLDSHGITVNIAHINLLADVMCSSGVVSGVTRFGIPDIRKKVKDGLEVVSPLCMASFEQTADNLLNAGIGNVTDHLEGISERVIVGRLLNVGTGDVKIC